MSLSSYADLLLAAQQQPEPQRLLFVFAAAELPAGHTAEQQERFQARQGGHLAPVMCVDKAPDDLANFAALVEESQKTGVYWDVVFVSSLSGRAGQAPNRDEAVQPLKMMVDAIKRGSVKNFAAFTRNGDVVRFL
ncbi:MAG TPA: ribonucleotide reductase subunit alpha [Burkholderiaceae bacterium]|jgi:hypothetical protein|nr:ribonucleotide reductase subunit alpha [Burkholderiaceae bacterium]